MSMSHRIPMLLALSAAAAVAMPARAGDLEDGLDALAHGWAISTYQTPEAQRDGAFTVLEGEAAKLVERFPDRAEPLVWQAIITSSHAQYQGLLAAGRSAKTARDELLAALKLDPDAMDGSAYTSLGSLYYKVPGWPLSFGDKDKARQYLQTALRLNPDGIDPNYFYGEFLLESGRKSEAASYLAHALAAPGRPGREDADRGRRVEIATLLAKAR
jgi:tetratricopeptide (TPR) repeat protein